MSDRTWQAQTKRELLIEVWESLDCESVGASELLIIQEVLTERFGNGGMESPASIARTLADEGAALRHPEVLMFDSEWREKRLANLDVQFGCVRISEALATIQGMVAYRRRANADGGVDEQLVSELAATFKKHAEVRARSPIVDPYERRVAKELAQWITIWIQDPGLFDNWLELRRRSPEFQRLFGEE
ncbi:MAG TPA: hypothetical protein VJ023_13755 [Pyrinomonadaceae bacterium]|nr:hypothetical protein [Pyrinomonadaceae bacterium]